MAETMAVNLASRRVLEETGLTFVRIFHQLWPYRVEGRELGDGPWHRTRVVPPSSRSLP